MPISGDKQLIAKLNNLSRTLSGTVPKRLGALALRHFLESFRNQGFTDERLVPWPKLKRTRRIGGKPVQGRILKGRGLLMNSIRVAQADWNNIRIVAGGPHVPYAKIHNEGGTIQGTANVRAHTRRAHAALVRGRKRVRAGGDVRSHTRKMLTYMPKRKYMGRSVVLENNMRQSIRTTIIESLVK